MTIRHVANMIQNSVMIRRAVFEWKEGLTPAETLAIKATNEVRQQAVESLERQADRWLSENKLIHAGAARKLAEELKRQIK